MFRTAGKQTQFKANSKPIKPNTNPIQTQSCPPPADSKGAPMRSQRLILSTPDLASSIICLQMLRQTWGRENLIGTGSASSKSVHILLEKSSPKIFILLRSEQPNPTCLAVLIIGRFSGFMFTSSQQIVSQAIGSVPPISQPRGLALPLIGPGPSIATTPSMMVKAGFKNLYMSMSSWQKSSAFLPFAKCQRAFRLPLTQPNIFLTANVATNC